MNYYLLIKLYLMFSSRKTCGPRFPFAVSFCLLFADQMFMKLPHPVNARSRSFGNFVPTGDLFLMETDLSE